VRELDTVSTASNRLWTSSGVRSDMLAEETKGHFLLASGKGEVHYVGVLVHEPDFESMVK
jgi:hypothetical protein